MRRSARAIGYAASGGSAYAEAASAAGWDGSSIPGFSPGGHIDASKIAAAAPKLEEAATELGQARDEVAPIDPGTLLGPLQDPIAQAKDEIDTRAAQAATAAQLARLLPSMLGTDGARTYLLVTMSPSDPRGAGGYPGVVWIDPHRRELVCPWMTSRRRPPIPSVAPVPGPADAKAAWHWAGIDTDFWDTTYTPDFPTAAGFMRRIWQAGGGRPVDGVIAGDPSMMADLIGVVGSVTTPIWPETIDQDNLEQIVGADVYRTKNNGQSNRWEVGIGAALWDAVLTRPWPPQAMGAAIADSAAGGHLRVWSSDPKEEAELDELGVSGAFVPPTAQTPVVTLNGFSANRAGYFAKTNVAVDHGRDEQGRPTTTVTVKIHSDAPTGPPSILLGVSKGDTGGKPIGTFATDVNVYVPKGSDVTNVTQDGHREVPFEWDELGAHAVSLSPFIQPGATVAVSVTYRDGD